MTNFDHKQIDDVIHGRVRLAIMAFLLSDGCDVDFTRLKKSINVSDGNLSTHMSKLEAANYIAVTKQFKGKRPQTLVKLTAKGKAAFAAYVAHLASLLPS